jgi:hypothetical protein
VTDQVNLSPKVLNDVVDVRHIVPEMVKTARLHMAGTPVPAMVGGDDPPPEVGRNIRPGRALIQKTVQ